MPRSTARYWAMQVYRLAMYRGLDAVTGKQNNATHSPVFAVYHQGMCYIWDAESLYVLRAAKAWL